MFSMAGVSLFLLFFTSLHLSFLLLIGMIVSGFIISIEMVKRIFYKKVKL